MEKVAMLNKLLWIETAIKKLNHKTAPEWVKKEYENISDNVHCLKLMVSGADKKLITEENEINNENKKHVNYHM